MQALQPQIEDERILRGLHAAQIAHELAGAFGDVCARIAEFLGVTKPSVTYTTKRLKENGYITMDKDGLITLTDSGMQIAASMLDRHKTLTKFLVNLGVDEITAETDACKMEHDLSEQSYRAICAHADRHGNTQTDHL